MSSLLISFAPTVAQSPLDIFGTHSGGSRAPSLVKQEWWSLSLFLLTEFDGRFADPDARYPEGVLPELRRQADLQASAGYNYFTYGRNHEVNANAENWFPFLPPRSSFSVAWSAHVGVTHAGLLTAAQNQLHDFRQVTRNYHPDPRDGHLLLGVDVEALFWPEGRWFAYGAHISLGTFHQEQGITAIASDRTGQIRSLLAVTAGWITNAGAGPHEITSAYADRYLSVRTRIDTGSRFGLGATFNSGTFPGETEFLLSLHLAIDLSSSVRLRFEHVNDLLGGKDRGFTGGGRFAVVKRY